MDNNTDPQNSPEPTAPQQPAPPAPLPAAPLPLDHSKTPNPQDQPQPLQKPSAPTSSQILPKHHNFPLHKALLIAAVTLGIIFLTAYVGVYYLLNQQLDKITKARTSAPSSISPSPATPMNTPAVTDELHFPGGPLATPSGEQVFCTQEAKQCSDGSYVSRTEPNCEFAACPQ